MADIKEMPTPETEGTPPIPEGLDSFLAQPEPGESPSGPINLSNLFESTALADDHPQRQPDQVTSPTPAGLDDFIAPELHEEKYGSLGQKAITGLEAAARGVAGPLAPLAEEKLLGVNPEDMRAREEANPLTSMASEAGGLGLSMLTGAGEGALVAKAGTKAMEHLVGESLASKIGAAAARNAIESALIQGSDEASRMIMQDPNQSLQKAITDVGLSAVLGGAIGGGIGAVSPLWKATAGTKLGQVAADFRGRLKQHVEIPDMPAAVTEELGDHYKMIKGLADEVYGAQGIKAQDIAHALPELHEGMQKQAQDIASKVVKSIDMMEAKPNKYSPRLVGKLKEDLGAYLESTNAPEATASDLFNATQELKQQLQGYARFDKMVKPVDEAYDFVKTVKNLAFDARNALENPKVWGKAAERQQEINAAFSKFKPALDDFEKKFTTTVNGEKVLDPAKVNTYINQLGKPHAEIKQEVLKNFLKASDQYADTIGASHANLGIESPIQHTPLVATKGTLDEVTTGAKLADLFLKKGLAESGGKALGATIGGLAGHHVGAGVPGALLGGLLGERVLGPFFKSILPALAKPLATEAVNSEGLKAATDYAASVIRGNTLTQRAIKSLFEAGQDILPKNLYPSAKDRDKLDRLIHKFRTQALPALSMGDKTGHYLPQHAQAMGETASRAVQYLGSLMPSADKQAPLDSDRIPSSTEVANYNRALDIAQQPLVVLDKMKKGTLIPQDLVALKTLYPSLYQDMSQKMLTNIIDAKNEGEKIPYGLKMAMSLFLGQPLDSTMMPQAIQSAQPQAAPQPSSTPGSTPRASHGVKSSPALQKMPTLYQTPGQARIQHKIK